MIRYAMLLLVLFPACASLDEDAVFKKSELEGLFVDWREAERRRDVELAEHVLYFEDSSDRDRLSEEFERLKSLRSGPVKTELEIHLVGYPPDWGPGEYLFLEPGGRRYVASRAAIVSYDDSPRIVYEPPLLTVKEREKLSPANQSRQRARMRIELWQELEGEALAEEVEKLKIQLMYQHRAQQYAEKNDLPLKKFEPDPGMLLIELSSLDDEAARRWIVERLQGTP